MAPGWPKEAPRRGIRSKQRLDLLVSSFGASKSPLWVPSWGALGALLSALGSVWGLCRACVVALLGDLVAIFKPQKPNESKKARRQKTSFFNRFLNDFGLPGASWRGSVDTCGNLGPVLELLISMLSAILDHRGLPEASLETILSSLGAFWRHLYPRQTPYRAATHRKQTPGEREGEGVNPSPKGKRVVEKKGLSKPPRPRGLVGLWRAIVS